jgi:hypothetical protein
MIYTILGSFYASSVLLPFHVLFGVKLSEGKPKMMTLCKASHMKRTDQKIRRKIPTTKKGESPKIIVIYIFYSFILFQL